VITRRQLPTRSFRMLDKHITELSDHSSSYVDYGLAQMNLSLRDVTACKSQGCLLLASNRSLGLVARESSQSRKSRSNCNTSGATQEKCFFGGRVYRGSTTFKRRRCLRLGFNHSWNESSPTGHEQRSCKSVATLLRRDIWGSLLDFLDRQNRVQVIYKVNS